PPRLVPVMLRLLRPFDRHAVVLGLLRRQLRHLFSFSGRRRPTSFSRDWSSDVCSPDLQVDADLLDPRPGDDELPPSPKATPGRDDHRVHLPPLAVDHQIGLTDDADPGAFVDVDDLFAGKVAVAQAAILPKRVYAAPPAVMTAAMPVLHPSVAESPGAPLRRLQLVHEDQLGRGHGQKDHLGDAIPRPDG